jgi:osmoprotectant transport system permease protein
VFGILLPVLATIGQGIGWLPAVIAVYMYSMAPIVRSTYTALVGLDPALIDAANGMGMDPSQRLWRVELPNAMPVIMVGVRVAVVMNIGITTIAAYIGAGGLGSPSSLYLAAAGVGTIGIMQVAQPALAVLWAYLLLDQTILPIQLLGMAMVLGGIIAVVTITRRGAAADARADAALAADLAAGTTPADG